MDLVQQLMDANKPKEAETTEPSAVEEETVNPSQEGEATPEETTEEPREETTEEQEEPSDDDTPDEDNIPFHKHPRFKQLIEERKQLRAELDEVRKAIEVQKAEPQNVEVPDWFEAQFADQGDVYQLWNQYQQEVQKQEEAFLQKMEQRFQQKQQVEQTEEQDMLAWVDEQVARVEETIGRELTEAEHNAVLSIAEKEQPLDKDGNIDLMTAFEKYELRQLKKQREEANKTETRKKIVAESTDTAVVKEPTSRDIPGPDTFRHGLTAALQNHFNK